MAALDGRRAIVTGASSGIGAATAAALAAGRSPRAHEARAATAARRHRSGELRAVRRDALAELGGIDILVNNAGLARGRDPAWEAGDVDEREVIETNVLGLMRMTRLCLPHLDRRRQRAHRQPRLGRGIWSYANGSSYVASKFAVHGYTRALRDDLQGKPVRVTNVAPGLVETDFSNVRFNGDEERAQGGLRGRRDRWPAACRGRLGLHHVRADAAAECERRRDRADGARPDVRLERPARDLASPAARALLPVALEALPRLPERRDPVVGLGVRRPRRRAQLDERLLARCPSRTRSAQGSSSASSRSRCATTSSWTPKWISASRSGARARIARGRRVPGLDVDVGRGRDGQDVTHRAFAHRLRRPRAGFRRGSS